MRASSAPAPVATCVARVLAAVLVLAAALVPATAHGQAACQPPDRMSTCFPADNVWAADGAGP